MIEDAYDIELCFMAQSIGFYRITCVSVYNCGSIVVHAKRDVQKTCKDKIRHERSGSYLGMPLWRIKLEKTHLNMVWSSTKGD